MVEALAMREGLALANRRGCHHIIAESDSLEIVDSLSGNQVWWSESSAIYAVCVDLAAIIGHVEFKHCPRKQTRLQMN
jgi:hypothetical protein